MEHRRLVKKIDPWMYLVEPYDEYTTPKYISTLSLSFPQNVEACGPYILSYDYIPGTPLAGYISRTDLEENRDIFRQLVNLYILLAEHGFYHGDPNFSNFIVDKDGILHIIDFGLAFTIGRETTHDNDPYRRVPINIENIMESLRILLDQQEAQCFDDDLLDVIRPLIYQGDFEGLLTYLKQ